MLKDNLISTEVTNLTFLNCNKNSKFKKTIK